MSERLTLPCPPEAFLEAILQSSAEGIVLLDPDGHILEWSEGAARLCGYSRDEVLGHDVAMIGLKSGAGSSPGSGAPVSVEATISRANGAGDIPVRVLSRALHDRAGQRVGTLQLVRELSEGERSEVVIQERERALADALRSLRRSHEQLKDTQLQLIQAAKLESIGRLAAGVAHEVKNPLAIILTGLQLLRRRVGGTDATMQETLDDLETAVKRANSVTMGLLDYAVSTELKLEAVNLEVVVDAAVRFVHHELQSRHVRLERQACSEIPMLLLDRTKIEQVLLNLLMNAIDAMPQGGAVTVRTSLRQVTQAGHGVGVRRSDVLRIGQTVAVVEVEDTGSGLSSSAVDRVFDPFFTTKPPGKGVGLGLSVSRMIAILHRGSLWLENRSEGGARATLLLRAGESQKGAVS